MVGAAKEALGNVINEVFEKKEAKTKRVLPSLRHMQVVSINHANNFLIKLFFITTPTH